MAGCCGTPAMAAAAIAGVIDRGAASGQLVRLVYVGGDPTVRPYTIDGNVYMFGNTERRRVNAVAARVVPFFLGVQSPNYGKFAEFDPALYTPEGLALAGATPSPLGAPDPNAGSPDAGKKKKGV